MTEIVIPNIAALLDEHLLNERALAGDREVAGGKTWRASKLGRCLRAQYLEFALGRPALQTESALSLRRFEVGHLWGRAFAGWFKGMGFDVEEEVDLLSDQHDLGAHGDYILYREDTGRFGVELKSVNSKSFWYRARREGGIASVENLVQAGICSVIAELPWTVLSVSKDDLTIEQDLVTDIHRAEALRRVRALNTARETGTPPPCTCTDPKGEWNGNGWRYCQFYSGDREADVRESQLDAKRKYKKFTPAPCCVVEAA